MKSGTVGWITLAAFVVGWDYAVALRGGGETLTGAFRRAIAHPYGRWPVTLAWTVTTAHLLGIMPPKLDPFQLIGKVGGRYVPVG